MAGKNGGKRPGAGRKPGSKNKSTKRAEEAREVLRRIVVKKLEPIVDAQVDLATGVWVEVKDRNGKKRVYQQPPSARAAQNLVEQIMGKPPASVDLTTDGKPLTMAAVLDDLEDDE